MKTISTQQEILLVTGTSLSGKGLSEKDDAGNPVGTDKEQLEKGCWNGLLKEWLPEIVLKTSDGRELYLWQITEADSFIELELGEYPGGIEKGDSINPHFFLSSKSYN